MLRIVKEMNLYLFQVGMYHAAITFARMMLSAECVTADQSVCALSVQRNTGLYVFTTRYCFNSDNGDNDDTWLF